jgi:hypothetical protein
VKNKKNFLNDPPPESEFQFDYDGMLPVCLAALEADEQLRKVRFWLVPKVCMRHRGGEGCMCVCRVCMCVCLPISLS